VDFSTLRLRKVLEDLTEEPTHFLSGQCEGLSNAGGGLINSANFAPFYAFVRTKKSFSFHNVEYRIKGASAQFVSMAGELFDHPQTKEASFLCMREDVETN